ncbi:MAG: hypothetical protein RIF33_26425 [Cyclobacteriaceae bacterium]
MKKIFNLMSIMAVLSLMVFASCSSDDGGDPDPDPGTELTPAQEQAAKLVADGATWTLTGADPVTVDGSIPDPEWTNFTLVFSGDENGGGFTTSNSASPIVWPSSGTWAFVDGSITQLVRNDGVTMTVNVTDTDITLSFEVEDPGSGRTLGFGGSWIFKLGI